LVAKIQTRSCPLRLDLATALAGAGQNRLGMEAGFYAQGEYGYENPQGWPLNPALRLGPVEGWFRKKAK